MSDIFGNLMKGLSSLMPQDDPDTQLLRVHTEVNDLKKQENSLYADIGRAAAEQYGLEVFGETADRLKLVQANLAAAEQKLADAERQAEERKRIEEERRQAEEAARAERLCPQCGCENPEGTKFCRECGAKLGSKSNLCPACGAENAPGTKFCQECGTKLQGEVSTCCPSCGRENPPGTRFCGDCGQRLEG